MLCEIHVCDFRSHFRQDFLAYCTRPVRVHLVMACVGSLFDNFSIFLLRLKQQQTLMKIVSSCIHFPIWPYPPIIMIFLKFYSGKPYGLTGMVLGQQNQMTMFHWALGNGIAWAHQLLPEPETSVMCCRKSKTSRSGPFIISLTTPSSMSTSTACTPGNYLSQLSV